MKLLIAGDSWGCGVWRRKIIHKGIEQFMLDDGHEVLNLSKGAISNLEIISQIRKEYESNSCKLDHFDYIFFIQSDPLRSAIHRPESRDTKWFENYQHLLEIKYDFLLDTYKQLNDFNIPIYMLGGCSNVDTTMLEKFSNLKLVMPSIPEFLVPGWTAPEIYFTGLWSNSLDKWDLDTLDKLIVQQRIWEYLKKNSSHFKDDGHHPDRHGYEKVYNYIKENVFK